MESRVDPGEHRVRTGRGHHGQAVGHHHAELVGRLDLIRPAQQVRHRRVLRRDPHHRAAADQEVADEQPPRCADEHDRQQEAAAAEVAQHHDLAAVEPVREQAAHRSEQQARQQRGEDHADEREVLREVVVGQFGDQAGEPEQGQPVRHAAQISDAPEPAERFDRQHPAYPVDRGRLGAPRIRAPQVCVTAGHRSQALADTPTPLVAMAPDDPIRGLPTVPPG